MLESYGEMFRYSDWADGRVLDAAEALPDEKLDAPFDMGRGTLRKTLVHVWAGHDVWLARWRGETRTPWPDEGKPITIAQLRERFINTQRKRSAFLAPLTDSDLESPRAYLDSLGGIFSATLGKMLIQGFTHAVHHRAQAVNMLRRLEAGLVELDYMMYVRTPMD